MDILYKILLFLGITSALLFALLVFFTGKGDAMSGGSAVRTTFKGKASFDDLMSKLTLMLGISFMVLMLALDVVGGLAQKSKPAEVVATPAATGQPAPTQPQPGTEPTK